MKVSIEISSMKRQLEEIKEKTNLTSREINIVNYILSFISFRIKILSDSNTDLEEFNKIQNEEEVILEILSKKELRALNQLILYKNIKREEIRKKNNLKKLRNKLMSKIQ